MTKIDNYVAFVKDQVGVQQKLARKYDEDSYRSGLHQKTASNFAELGRFLEEIQKKGTQQTAYLNRGDSPQKRILLTFEEIENAPDELLKELNLTDTDRQELMIEFLIADAGGVLSLDKIMIELYKRTREVPKRNALVSRLYRMASRGMIYNVPGKKGVYSTYELSEAEAKKMFGQFDGEVVEETASQVSVSAPSPAPPPTPKSATGDRLKAQFLSSASPPIRRRY